MKKVNLFLIACFIVTLCCSCKAKSEDHNEPNYQVFQDDITIDTSKKPSAVETEDSDIIITNEKEWPFVTEFSGIKAEDEPSNYSNLGINLKSDSNISLICPDNQNDIIYYVNHGKDNYIYQLKDGISSLLVDMEANYLQLWNGELYFLSRKSSIDFLDQYYSGDIYCYNLTTNKLRLILETDAVSLLIDNYGIFYNTLQKYDTNSFIFTGYNLDYNSTSPQKIGYTRYSSYKEYILINTSEGMSLINSTTDEKITLIPHILGNVCIYGDSLYFSMGTCIYIMDLITGNKQIYDINNYEYIISKNQIINDYTVINNILYITCGGDHIYRIDMGSGEIYDIPIDITINNDASFDKLFTNGSRLFATRNDISGDGLVELIISGYSITSKEIGQ